MRWFLFILTVFSCGVTIHLMMDNPQIEESVAVYQPSLAEVEQRNKEVMREIEELWKKDQRVDATKKLQSYYLSDLAPLFSQLYADHPMEVMQAEHQVGWVLHRLTRNKSNSFRYETSYLQKLEVRLDVCFALLPKEEPQEESAALSTL